MTAQQSRDQLKLLLLDMISTSRAVEAERLDPLCAADWDILCHMAKQHRLDPILHHHSHAFGWHASVPEAVRNAWSAAFRHFTIRSLVVQQTLMRIGSVLEQAAIPYAALKGAWLVQYAYPHPALRPMRDIDILVDKDDAVTAFELFENRGFHREEGDSQPLSYYLEKTRDMPILYCDRTDVKFEIHFGLTHQQLAHKAGMLADSYALLGRRQTLPSTSQNISYLDPTDTLLHLIVHSVYDHKFNNGPLILNDIANMVQNTEVDWSRFWGIADATGWRKGCEVIFALTSFYHHGSAPFLPDLQDVNIPSDLQLSVQLLMLQEFEARNVVALRSELKESASVWQRFQLLWQKASTERHVLATFAGLDADSRFFWLGYPIWAIVRSQQFLFGGLDGNSQSDIRHSVRVGKWLRSAE